MKIFGNLSGCQGDTRVVGGACHSPDILKEDGGRLPWRPSHGQLQDLLHSLCKISDSFLRRGEREGGREEGREGGREGGRKRKREGERGGERTTQ